MGEELDVGEKEIEVTEVGPISNKSYKKNFKGMVVKGWKKMIQ